ncbi:MAG: hypothetical protein P8N90_07795, partial [Glaciecola sp.]|nr:hypothetical protein [Glaciecola sp.]
MSFSTFNLTRCVRQTTYAMALLSFTFAGGAQAKSVAQNTVDAVSELNHQAGVLSYQIPNATVRISALSDYSFEVFYEPHHSRQLPSFALTEQQSLVATRVNTNPTYIEF